MVQSNKINNLRRGFLERRLASPEPVFRGTAKGSDVVAHDSARHSVNLCAIPRPFTQAKQAA